MYIGLHVSNIYPCPILMKFEFSRQIFEKYSNIMKIRVVRAELFHANRKTDRRNEAKSLFAISRTRLKTVEPGYNDIG